MSTSSQSVPFVGSVLHPTDFSESSQRAFVHALAISLLRQTRLSILHAGKATGGDWSSFPSVRATLERWGLLEPGSPKSAVFDELSMRVSKLQISGDPVKATLDEVAAHRPDLIVVGTEGRDGVARFLRPSVAQRIARGSSAQGTMTLFVPGQGRGFVRPDDGRLELRRILVPVTAKPAPSEVLVRVTRVASVMGDGDVEITLLHVGGEFPAVSQPEGEGWSYRKVTCSGDVIDEILSAAEGVDLIAMATEGRDGVLDALRGSITERIVRGATCPLLAVPSA